MYTRKPKVVVAYKWDGKQETLDKIKEMVLPYHNTNPVEKFGTDLYIKNGDHRVICHINSYVVVDEAFNFLVYKEGDFKANFQEGNIEDISDGFHTFKELYEHRIRLWISLCKAVAGIATVHRITGKDHDRLKVWRSMRHDDGELAFCGEWFILGIAKEKGNVMTYHLPIEYWDECAVFSEEIERAVYDGHTSDDVLERLKSFI